MSRRALITGAAGFVGPILRTVLKERGWLCVGVDASDGADHRVDITDAEQVDRLFASAGDLTHVFHLAAITFVPQSRQDPTGTIRVNVEGTIRLAHATAQHHPGARFVFIGTSEIYGAPQQLPVDEEHPVAPNNPYAISKLAADQYCAYLGRTTGLDVVRMRPFNHSGPGQSDRFVLSSFARQIAEIEAGVTPPVLKTGNLEAARDFSHVRDVVRAYALAAEQGEPGAVYNVCSGNAYTIQDALDALLAMSDANIEVRQDPDRMRPSDVPEVRGSYAKLEAATGWTPAVAFDELLHDLLTYWRARVWEATAS